MYARSYLEGVISEDNWRTFAARWAVTVYRRTPSLVDAGLLAVPTVSMGLGPIQAIYQPTS
ncbi:MAG: hypothetical protein CM15mP25_3760 [Gammaproteobacteria bacterium]|nr:MAG: hypothetical protein CM15mP25_3760 [Gammaproteobacteria bacterium]